MPKAAGSDPAAQKGTGGGGVGRKVTRKYFAVTAGKVIVCSGAPPRARMMTLTKMFPVVACLQGFLGNSDAGQGGLEFAGVFGEVGD